MQAELGKLAQAIGFFTRITLPDRIWRQAAPWRLDECARWFPDCGTADRPRSCIGFRHRRKLAGAARGGGPCNRFGHCADRRAARGWIGRYRRWPWRRPCARAGARDHARQHHRDLWRGSVDLLDRPALGSTWRRSPPQPGPRRSSSHMQQAALQLPWRSTGRPMPAPRERANSFRAACRTPNCGARSQSPLRWRYCSVGGAGLIAAIIGGSVAALLHLRVERRIGGYTGDTLGAMEQVCEIAVMLALSAMWSVS